MTAVLRAINAVPTRRGTGSISMSRATRSLSGPAAQFAPRRAQSAAAGATGDTAAMCATWKSGQCSSSGSCWLLRCTASSARVPPAPVAHSQRASARWPADISAVHTLRLELCWRSAMPSVVNLLPGWPAPWVCAPALTPCSGIFGELPFASANQSRGSSALTIGQSLAVTTTGPSSDTTHLGIVFFVSGRSTCFV